MRAVICAVAAALVSACVAQMPSGQAALETIRFEMTSCDGRCPALVLEVRSDLRASFDGRAHTAVNGRRDFTVTPERLEEYKKRLAPFRPVGERRIDQAACGENFLPGMPSIDVRWTGAGRADRLLIDTGCDPKAHEELVEAVGRAPEVLGITHWVRGD